MIIPPDFVGASMVNMGLIVQLLTRMQYMIIGMNSKRSKFNRKKLEIKPLFTFQLNELFVIAVKFYAVEYYLLFYWLLTS